MNGVSQRNYTCTVPGYWFDFGNISKNSCFSYCSISPLGLKEDTQDLQDEKEVGFCKHVTAVH